MRHFRFEVVETLFLIGIRISTADILRPLFERYAQRLTSSSPMNDPIPAVLAKGKEKLKAELLHNVKEARLGEPLVIVLVWADRPTRLRNTRFGFLALSRYIFALTCIPLMTAPFFMILWAVP